jgi:DNA anti-recombination protein RmuC
MPYKIVAHPETGKPVKEEVSYVDIERGQLENDVNQAQNELDNANRELSEARELVTQREERVAKAEGALGEAKSGVASYDAIEPQDAPEGSPEGSSSEGENATPEGEVSVPVVQF